jgi:hypothetical protein
MGECSSSQESFLVRHGLPFIGELREALFHRWVPLQDSRAVGTLGMAFSISSVGNVPKDIPCALSTCDVPTVGPTR